MVPKKQPNKISSIRKGLFDIEFCPRKKSVCDSDDENKFGSVRIKGGISSDNEGE